MGRIEDEIKQRQVKNATGSALSFTSINGIGPATAKKIKNADYSIKAPRDIQDMSADELSDKAGISRSRAAKAIRGGGGNPNVSKRSNTGSVSAAGIKQRTGDFWVKFSAQDKARARNDPRSRSEEAVRQDERRRAPITTDFERWKNNKSGLDFPGVDTPTQNPDLLPKDLKQKQQPDTTDFEARDEREQKRREQSYPRKTESASGKENFILETGDERIPASEETAEAKGVDPFGIFAEARDVSLAPEEATRGVGLGTPSAPGGQAFNAIEGRPMEIDRTDQEQEPPEQALEAQSRGEMGAIPDPDTGPEPVDEIEAIYDEKDPDIGYVEYRKRVERVSQELGLTSEFDTVANAKMVAESPDVLDNV